MRVVVPGSATGTIMVLSEPLSFWGGIDTDTGDIIDNNHPQAGENVTGVILAMPHGRGSSSSASVLAESIRLGTAPVGLILRELDEILVVGAMVANELYNSGFPIAVGDFPKSRGGRWILDVNGLNPG